MSSNKLPHTPVLTQSVLECSK